MINDTRQGWKNVAADTESAGEGYCTAVSAKNRQQVEATWPRPIAYLIKFARTPSQPPSPHFPIETMRHVYFLTGVGIMSFHTNFQFQLDFYLMSEKCPRCNRCE